MIFFPVDVTICNDIKIQKLTKKFTASGFGVYIYLLGKIYENGYYLENDEDLNFIISNSMNIEELLIEQIINYMVEIKLFDKYMFKNIMFLLQKEYKTNLMY